MDLKLEVPKRSEAVVKGISHEAKILQKFLRIAHYPDYQEDK